MALNTLKFHLLSLTFTPYSYLKNELDSNQILFKVITQLSKELQAGNGYVIDKHEHQKKENPREIFLTSAVILPREKRIKCTMALIRSGRQPKIKPKDQFELVPIETLGVVVEETHFFIDYNLSYAILCVEYHHHGPRYADIEFYFRRVARDVLKISKTTSMNMYMNNKLTDVLSNLKNVLNLEVKIKPKKIAQMDKDIVGNYFLGMNDFGNKIKPKFVRMEAYFQSPGQSKTSKEINIPAVKMVTNLLTKFKARPFNIDCFEDFVVKYEDKEGKEDFFNLLKGKEEFIYENIEMNNITKRKHWYSLIVNDFNNFVSSKT